MTQRLSLVVLVCCTLVGSTRGGDDQFAAELRLKPVAVVSGRDVRIGDICEVVPAHGRGDRAMDVALGVAPAPGTVAVWSRADVARRIHQALGREVRLSGADRVYVTLDVATVKPGDVANVAERWLRQQLGNASGPLLLQPRVLLEEPVYVPRYLGEPQLEVRAPSGGVTGKGRLRVDVAVRAGNRQLAVVPVYFEPKRPKQAEQPDSSEVRQAAYESRSEESTRPVLIEMRQPVNIRIRLGNLVVVARGEAMERGREGEFIRVRNTRSGKVLTARVIDTETVEIPF